MSFDYYPTTEEKYEIFEIVPVYSLEYYIDIDRIRVIEHRKLETFKGNRPIMRVRLSKEEKYRLLTRIPELRKT